jgi:uncharacterized protein (DUF58 family)
MAPSKRGLLIAASGIALALLPALVSPALWTAWAFFWAILLFLFGLDAALTLRAGAITAALDPPGDGAAAGAGIDRAAPALAPAAAAGGPAAAPRPPRTLYVGATHAVSLRLTAPHLRGAEGVVALDLSGPLAPEPPRKAALGPEAAPVAFSLAPTRRGPAEVEAAWVRYEGPLGLLLRTVRIPLAEPLRVVANTPAVRAAALRFFGQRESSAGLKIERFLGDGSEFDALREFMPGLDRRAIDWKASARHTKLLAREYRAERSHQVVLAVDTGRLMAEPLAGIPRLDHAVHAALLLAFVSARAGDRVSLFAFDERPRVYLAPRSGVAGFRAVLERSGELAYSGAETNYTLGLTELLARLTRRSLVIVLTDFVDTVTAELMVENITRLSRKHLVVFVALRDPLFAELAGAAPQTMLDVHRAVVADALLFDREVVLKRLSRRGVFCVDAPPGRVGPDLVNRYLEIKRRELI